MAGPKRPETADAGGLRGRSPPVQVDLHPLPRLRAADVEEGVNPIDILFGNWVKCAQKLTPGRRQQDGRRVHGRLPCAPHSVMAAASNDEVVEKCRAILKGLVKDGDHIVLGINGGNDRPSSNNLARVIGGQTFNQKVYATELSEAMGTATASSSAVTRPGGRRSTRWNRGTSSE